MRQINISGRGIKAYDRIIFLDFDGVLAIDDPQLSDLPQDSFGTVFKHQCVIYLSKVIDETSAEIVITSSWTNYLSLRKIRQMWRFRNLPGTVVDAIRNYGMDRSRKIDNWLAKYNVSKYVIIDDMDSRQFDAHHHQHLVTTSPLIGLSENDIERICRAMKV